MSDRDRRPRRDDSRPRRDDSHRPRRDRDEAPRREEAPRPVPVQVSEAQCVAAGELLAQVLNKAGFQVTVQPQYGSQVLTFRVVGPDAARIAANARGYPQRALIQALKTLIQRKLWSEDAVGPYIQIEVADFLARQDQAFAHLSQTLAKTAREGLRCEVVGMSSADRRILHQLLPADVSGQSEGLGIFRRLVIQTAQPAQ